MRKNVDTVIYSEAVPKSEFMGLIETLENIGAFTIESGSWDGAATIKKVVLEKTLRILGNKYLNTTLTIYNLH